MDRETKEFLGTRGIVGLSCLLMIIAGYLILTLPDGEYCKLNFKNGGSIDMPKSQCKNLVTLANLEKEVNERMINNDWEEINFTLLSMQKPNLTIGVQDKPPVCPECVVPKCEKCPECVVPKCEKQVCPVIEKNLEKKLLNLKPLGNEHAYFQQGFFNCKKKVREEIISRA